MSLQAQVRAARGTFRLEVDLSVHAMQVLAVLGPNGAGKTTLLRLLAGLERIDHGQIRLDGVLVDDGHAFVPPQRRHLGVVFQDYALFGHLTVLENVAFGPRARGVRTAQARRMAGELLERLGIGDLAGQRPGAISGGQGQRVALARALATSPTGLLLDEPLSALDVQTRQSVRVELARQLAEFPGWTLLVTHDPLDALLLADRILVLEQGSATQQGAAAELARRPATAYVAALMGMNLLSGTARQGELQVESGGVLHIADTSLNGRALAVIRPEAVTISLDRPQGSARNAWPGTVVGVESGHDRVRVHVEGRPSMVAAVTAAAVAELRLIPGRTVWLSVKAVEIDAYASGSP